ncbi:unnamed protein product [Pylaiella littoralis]
MVQAPAKKKKILLNKRRRIQQKKRKTDRTPLKGRKIITAQTYDIEEVYRVCLLLHAFSPQIIVRPSRPLSVLAWRQRQDNSDGGSSVLSDNLGEIAFTDDEESSIGSSSSSDKGEADDARGSAAGAGAGAADGTSVRTPLGLEEKQEDRSSKSSNSNGGGGAVRGGEEGGGGGGEAGASAPVTSSEDWSHYSSSGSSNGQVGAPSNSRPAAPPSKGVSATAAATTAAAVNPAYAVATAPRTTDKHHSSGGCAVFSGAASGIDGVASDHAAAADSSSLALPSVPAAVQTASDGNEGVQRRQRHATLPQDVADHHDANTRGTTTYAPAQLRAQQRQQQQQRSCHGTRAADIAGSSSDTSNSRSNSSFSLSRSDSAAAPTAAPTAAAAAPSATISGADSGGGGVSSYSSLQTVVPGSVPTATCKVLVVGNAKCGKSSIISRFVSNRFSSDYNSTVGADYAMKDVSLQSGRQVRLQLWDIAGQDRFAKLTRAYFRRAKGAVVVCDVTREGTFDAIVRWKEEIDLWCQNEGCELPVYLFANKCDLLMDVQDSFLAGARMEKTCRDSGFAGWYITSAKRGDNINTAMTNLLEHALEVEDLRHSSGPERERPLSKGERDGDGDGDCGGGGGGGRPKKGEAFQLSSRGGTREGSLEGPGTCCA